MRLFIPFLWITNFLSSSPLIWVVNNVNETVSIIDGATNQLATSISQSQGMFSAPFAIAFTPNGRFAYITNFSSSPNTVSVIDTSTYQLVTRIDLGLTGSGPFAMAASPNGDLVMLTNSFANAVSVISTETNTVIATLSIPFPLGIAFSNDGAFAYVCEFLNNSIAVIDTAALTVSVPHGFNLTIRAPNQIAVSPDGTYAYVGSDQNEIFNINLLTNTVNGTIPLPPMGVAEGIAFSADGSMAYVVDANNAAVDIIDTSTSTVTTQIDAAAGMFFHPKIIAVGSNHRFYVTNQSDSSLSVLSTETNELVQLISRVQGDFGAPHYVVIQPGSFVQRAYHRPSNRRPANN